MDKINLSGLPFSSRITSGNDSSIHCHDFFEYFYIIEGSITHLIDGTEELLSIGDAVIIAPDIAHNFKRVKHCLHRDNMISPSILKEACDFLDKSLYEKLLQSRYTKFHIPKDGIVFFEKSIISFKSLSDVTLRKYYEKSLVVFLLSFIILPSRYDKQATNNFQAECLDVIGDVYTSPDAIDLVYKRLNFNKSYICKKFKDTFGMTLTEYINDLRIKQAAYLLSTTDYVLSEICEMIGLKSLPYFIKLFKECYHTTPANFRKKDSNLPIEVSKS